VVKALNLAEKFAEAWGVLTADMLGALARMEQHHEILSLLRPMFKNGWSAPPTIVDDRWLMAHRAALALVGVGRRVEGAFQELLSINENVKHGVTERLVVSIRGHSRMLRELNELELSGRALELSRELCDALPYAPTFEQELWRRLYRVADLVDHGDLRRARRLWDSLSSALSVRRRTIKEAKGLLIRTEAWLLFREGLFDDRYMGSAFLRARSAGERLAERDLWHILGLSLSGGRDITKAIEAFDQAIQMARNVGISAAEDEVERGILLARNGRTAEAEATAFSVQQGTSRPHGALADLWSALRQRERSLSEAVLGYRWAWADGPPNYHHWDLQRCHSLFAAFGAVEPVVSPDPRGIKTLPYEDELNRVLVKEASIYNP
jgi:tetratricopeptide (TPR) repeat protein